MFFRRRARNTILVETRVWQSASSRMIIYTPRMRNTILVEVQVWQPRLPHPHLHKKIIPKSAAMRNQNDMHRAFIT
jgi:hypothetical protein